MNDLMEFSESGIGVFIGRRGSGDLFHPATRSFQGLCHDSSPPPGERGIGTIPNKHIVIFGRSGHGRLLFVGFFASESLGLPAASGYRDEDTFSKYWFSGENT